ncbi:MAG: iron-containing alcohol dehydrogenase [Halioglobus sp.]
MRLIDIVVNKLIQLVLSIVRRFLHSPLQLTFCGEGSTEQLVMHIVRTGHKKILLVTDKPLVELGLAGRVVDAATSRGAEVAVYDGVLPDPTVAVVAAALSYYHQHNCDAVVALGGGSSIDTAKTVAAAATNGGIEPVMGLFKVKTAPAPLFAIPTTAGTGSEASWFAVISDTDTHQKTGIGAPVLLPKATALDASLMTGLPKSITAATGMDALTHAIETFIAPAANEEVRSLSLPAAQMVFANLREAYANGGNVAARESMAIASYYAGISLNISAVGTVHAIAHQLGAKYGTPHGLANAIVLPHVLDLNVEAAGSQLAELADMIGLCAPYDSEREKAEKLVAAVRELNDALDIPLALEALRPEDILDLVKEAAIEARTYSVPTILGRDQIASILNKLVA